MSTPSHITMMNGSSRTVLVDTIRGYEEQIRFTLNRMNGSRFWAWCLWRAPEGANVLETLPDTDEFLQCAGSAEAMTIEVRVLDDDGAAHHYTVGKPGEAVATEPGEMVTWDDGRFGTRVYPNEVFTADEAAAVFSGYFRNDEVGSPFTLRPLDLD